MSQLFDHGVSTLVYLKNTKGILYLIYEPGSILHVIYTFTLIILIPTGIRL